ncbi:hypothetical protein L6452_39781 [Arctium lappa]|uniref:Uncharacterized protein n=1 Tax=Arctium lappa TaxID=4217 RepID=A0ACB8XSL4_ARCLA|nr:hypothetical protein L6452_39781 [Arctium lappa]
MEGLECKEMRILKDTSMITLGRSLDEHLMLSTAQTLEINDLATRAIVPGDSAKGTIAGHNREAPPAHGTTWAIVPSAIVPRHYRVAQSPALTSPRYLFGDSALRDSARGTIAGTIAGHPHNSKT